jgi:hypothetical protein
MSHFASGQWNNPAGLVNSVDALAQTSPPTSGTAGVREGIDKFTFVVPRAGFYRIHTYIRVVTVGTGAGNNLIAQVAYNDGSAVAAATILPTVGLATPTAAVNVTTAGQCYQSTGIWAAAGSTITVTVLPGGTVTTTGVMDVHVTMEAV